MSGARPSATGSRASHRASKAVSTKGFDPARKKGRGECGTCFGTGQILCLNSAFLGAGFRRERCGICTGTGRSTYRDDPVYIRWQRKARIMETAMRRAPKGLDEIALGKIAREAVGQ